LRLGAKAPRLRLGDNVWLIPGHCDPTVNLHDWYVGVRGDRVEALWAIGARGAST
jgi:3-hydroxy-D-aspartate aldolase